MKLAKFIAVRTAAVVLALATSSVSVPALAVPILRDTGGVDLSTKAYSFTFGDSSFTFSATGDIFNPIAITTSGTGKVNSFGGFLGIPLTPTSYFINRGTVTFGPGSYDAFPNGATVPYSNSDNYIGLLATIAGRDYYGFAYTADATFNLFGFESVAGASITATNAVPESSSWIMMISGFGLVGSAARYRRRSNGLEPTSIA